jgi:LacI family transcriptional regulator
MKLPTQSDIARLAGVSRATVSFVLSGRSGGTIAVTEETRQRVLQVAKELGYEPNASAVSLRLKKTHNIGITLPNLSNPHMQEILCGAAQEALEHDYNLLVFYTEMNSENEKASIRELLRGRIDGLVMLPSFANALQEEFSLLSERRNPVVIAGNYYSQFPELDSVTPGHDRGAALVMKHLLDLGHREIGLLFGVPRKPLGKERLDAYTSALREAEIPIEEGLTIETGTSYQDGYEAALRLLQRKSRPTAILAINDVLAVGALHAASDAGLCIPEDLSVAGFDNNDYTAFLNPPLTTVNVNAREIGAQSLRLVVRRIEEPERPFEHLRIPFELIVRASTGPVPTRSVRRAAKVLSSVS